ncbi:MAG: hypothetical protein JXR96_27250 [Deltaproteobacteria bacterium]|nr:hypothetical protein [Deltaproteobacteria bacterium]
MNTRMPILFSCLAVCLVLGPGCGGDTAANQPPVAVAGFDVEAVLGDVIQLDGSASFDPDGDSLVFAWEVLYAPPEAWIVEGLIADADRALARFTPSEQGEWTIGLTVSDAAGATGVDSLQVTVRGEPCTQDIECDDRRFCTGIETCADGICQPGTPVDCSALDATCASGVCDEEQDACAAEPLAAGSPCEDGLFCTVEDACDGYGACSGAPRECAAADSCRPQRCDEQAGACVEDTPLEDGMPCDDGLYCNVGETCLDGSCQGGAPRECTAAAGSCIEGVCDEQAGACVGETLPDGSDCDDGDACTLGDACESGECVGAPVDCTSLDSACTRGVCDPRSGECTAEQLEDGSPCEDGAFCNHPDTCQAGACQPGPQRSCVELADECNAGVCDEQADACTAVPVRDDEFCDDGLFCTVGTTCRDGACAGGAPYPCPDSEDGCSLGRCDEEARACASDVAPDGAECDDGDDCTVGDTCRAGVCQPGGPCPLGCNTDYDPPTCYQVQASNAEPSLLCVPLAGSLELTSGEAVLDTDAGTLDGEPVPTYMAWPQSDPGARELGVFSFERIEIGAGTTLRITGSRPCVLLACEDAVIDGILDASARGEDGGPGGYDGGASRRAGGGYAGAGGGAGSSQTRDPYRETGGGGGGNGGAGGAGGDSDTQTGGAGGAASGPEGAAPLVGGGGGGGGGSSNRRRGGPGGGGGGGLQITAGGEIQLGASGRVLAAGAGGQPGQPDWSAGGGGGAGGAILLEAVELTIAGQLEAGGGGGGGADTSSDGACAAGTPEAGQDGQPDAAAAGGQGCDTAGEDGGAGGAGGCCAAAEHDGEKPPEAFVSGGGGGGAGRIRIHSYQGTGVSISGSTNPDCQQSGSACTQGEIQIW